MASKVVTANRLVDGEVLYLTAAGEWSERLDEAGVGETKDREAAFLAVAEHAVRARLVVEPYLIPVAEEEGALVAQSQRERIRALGPTVRLDLGKQAVGG